MKTLREEIDNSLRDWFTIDDYDKDMFLDAIEELVLRGRSDRTQTSAPDRTQIAAMAMHGITTSMDRVYLPAGEVAKEAVKYADALIAELEKTKP